MKMNASKLFGLTLILGLFLACGNKPKNSLSYDYDKAAAYFAADESFFPILDEELDVFMATAPWTASVRCIPIRKTPSRS